MPLASSRGAVSVRVVASAPGKLALLGEYAVLHGTPALVLAVDRTCRAVITSSSDADCHLETRFPVPQHHVLRGVTGSTGAALVDLVRQTWPGSGRLAAWRAVLDSAAFHAAGTKLGLGSSAAALVAFAGGWTAWIGQPRPTVTELVALHRTFQGGAGSGLDVAAAVTGGVIEFRLDAARAPCVAALSLPPTLGLVGVFTGVSASTPNLLARYHAWRAAAPGMARERQHAMEIIAGAGCQAAREGDVAGLLRAVDDYGRQLELLGHSVGTDIVTAEHRAVREMARGHGLVYKVSGAGGGDLGIAMGSDAEALGAFARQVTAAGCPALDLKVAPHGLHVEGEPA